jgi:hypothetical protein
VAIGFLIALRSFSQTTAIKVRKPFSQVDAPWHVTIAGKYAGTITKAELLMDPQFKIAFNTIGLRIISYEMTNQIKGKLCMWGGLQNDTLSTETKKQVLQTGKGTMLVFDRIKAVSKTNDTIYLNPISLKVLE